MGGRILSLYLLVSSAPGRALLRCRLPFRSVVLGFGILLGASNLLGAAPRTAIDVRAELVVRVAQFTEWRAGSGDNSLEIAVYDDTAFARALTKAVKGRQAGDLSLRVRSISNLRELGAARMVCFPDLGRRRLVQLLREVPKEGVLSLGLGKAFLESEGMISFVVIDGGLKPRANLDSLKKSKLKLRSVLMRLLVK